MSDTQGGAKVGDANAFPSQVPTGRILPTADGVDIVLVRLIRGTIQDVWASITESDRTARWFGRWEGEGAQGALLRLQMGFEESQPWCDVRVESCEPPHHLGLRVVDAAGDWSLEITLRPRGDRTELTFVHHRENADGAGEIGPGWEYYLDNLVASRLGVPLPTFDDYYPSMQKYYQDQVSRG
jgi:uncharacterized protein YndB with AHSA1/START domain